jgi:hypothetical protein
MWTGLVGLSLFTHSEHSDQMVSAGSYWRMFTLGSELNQLVEVGEVF